MRSEGETLKSWEIDTHVAPIEHSSAAARENSPSLTSMTKSTVSLKSYIIVYACQITAGNTLQPMKNPVTAPRKAALPE